MKPNIISLNMANIITIALVAVAAFALANYVQEKTGYDIPYVK